MTISVGACNSFSNYVTRLVQLIIFKFLIHGRTHASWMEIGWNYADQNRNCSQATREFTAKLRERKAHKFKLIVYMSIAYNGNSTAKIFPYSLYPQLLWSCGAESHSTFIRNNEEFEIAHLFRGEVISSCIFDTANDVRQDQQRSLLQYPSYTNRKS
jgi:hypothetical protein